MRIALGLATLALVTFGAGCTALVDGVAGETEQEHELSGQDPLKCHMPQPTASTVCPAACTDGCSAGTCIIACDADQPCHEAVVACPDGLHCRVECTADKSCEKSEILCPEGTACEVRCAGDDACRDALIVASETGPLSLTCEGQPHECHGTTLVCGTSACVATCAADEHPNIQCQESCDCQPCENPTTAPPEDD